MQNESLKKLLVVTAGAVLIFWLLKPKGENDKGGPFSKDKKNDGFIRKPILDEGSLQHEDLKMAYDTLCVYIDACNAKESPAFLEDLKADIFENEGLDIYTDANGKLAVRDADGSDILKY